MKLKDLTVKTFAGLWDILNAKHFETSVDRQVSMMTFLTGKPESYYYEMTMPDFRKAVKILDIVTLEGLEAKPQRFIKANGKTYAPVFNFNKFTGGQLVDILTFTKETEDVVMNLPKILASICVPTKRGVFGLKLLPYGSVDHTDVCADMENASIVDAYAIAVFFWEVLKRFLENTGDYLVTETIKNKAKAKQKLTEKERAALLTILQVFGDGITARKKSQ